jgi:hypothetical protein
MRDAMSEQGGGDLIDDLLPMGEDQDALSALRRRGDHAREDGRLFRLVSEEQRALGAPAE